MHSSQEARWVHFAANLWPSRQSELGRYLWSL